MMKSKKILLFIALLMSSSLLLNDISACTRVMSNNNGQAILVGRTMDWSHDMQTNFMVYPRGMERVGMTAENPIKWTSQYGSIVATVFDLMTTDGMNERGFAAHILWLDETDYGQRNNKNAGMSVMMWAQFYLDNFATVAEAVMYSKENSFQLESPFIPGTDDNITVHLAVEDSTGDSAIIEYVKGVQQIYHQRDYLVLTNSPTFDQQLKNMKWYKGLGGDKPLPGTTDASDRFVRAAYYVSHLPKANSVREAVSGMLSVVQNIAEPFGISEVEGKEIEPTFWRTISDLTHKTYYFNDADNPNFIWTNLDKFNLNKGAPVMKLDLVNQRDLMGEISAQFKPQ